MTNIRTANQSTNGFLRSSFKNLPASTLIILTAVCIIIAGCQRPSRPKVVSVDSQKLFEHTVIHKGEHLTLISHWYTGSAKNWQTIKASNPHIDPARIRVGDTIMIPEYLLTTTDPLPKSHVQAFAVQRMRYLQKSPRKGASGTEAVRTPSSAREETAPPAAPHEEAHEAAMPSGGGEAVPHDVLPTFSPEELGDPDPLEDGIPDEFSDLNLKRQR